jgi:hypothetical protein
VTTIPFTFDPETHIYHVEGEYCLSTSDVIQLAGLSDYSGVPIETLEKARVRGTRLHQCIHYYEENDLDLEDIDEELSPFFQAYLEWKEESGFIPIPPFEKAIVYPHLDMHIGCHLDLRGYIPGRGLYVLDMKTSYPNSGAAKKQTHLRWRLQLESYKTATEGDLGFWESAFSEYEPAPDGAVIQKAVLHVHPKAKDVFIEFPMDDSAAWDACVSLASIKLANGYKVVKS